MSLISSFIQAWQNQFQKPRITVVGDAMVDQYYDVQATRISPEFPIPVMRSSQLSPTESRPGGAANVAYQMKHWDTDHMLYAWSDDEALRIFQSHIYPPYVTSPSLNGIKPRIPRKMRIYDGKHPAFRWDIESSIDPSLLDGLQSSLQTVFQQMIKYNGPPDILILSDYNKGTFDTSTRLGMAARSNWISKDYVTIVDPKAGPLFGWSECTIFKPNKKEAEDLSGKKDWRDQCRFFLFESELKCQHVVITQGHEGVVGMSRNGNFKPSEFEYRPDFNIDPKSVIGAGDCFIVFLAMAQAHGFSLAESSEIAYKAGACYVQHDRNEPVTPHELLAFEDPIAAKFIPPIHSNKNLKLGFTNGCFDLLHVGHVESLRFAKKHCDKLIVAVNDDESVRRLKSPNSSDSQRPIIPIQDRMRMLASLDCVDYVMSFGEDTPIKLIESLRPDILIKGEDYRNKEVIGASLAKEVIFAPLVEGKSTSSIEASIQCSVKSA